jgi:catechol 2,3-dioxygenase-like lactoylglutathione lyase family enzyme
MSPGAGAGLTGMSITNSHAGVRISEIGASFVAVADQERALEFYRDTLGFELRADFAYGGGIRWVEVAPPGAANSIALVGPGEGRPADSERTYCAFATADIEADHAALLSRGVDVDEIAAAGSSRAGLLSTDVIVPDPVPAQFLFRDPDGNRFLVVQSG